MPIDEWKVACPNTEIYAGLVSTVVDNTHPVDQQIVAGYMNQFYSQGANKCYLFNMFYGFGNLGGVSIHTTDQEMLNIYRTCGDAQMVATMARRNIVANADMWTKNQYLPLPMQISASKKTSLSLSTGPINVFALLLIGVAKGGAEPTVAINGAKCAPLGEYDDAQRIASAKDALYAYVVPLSALNEIKQELTFSAKKDTQITYVELRTEELATEFKEKPSDVLEEYQASKKGKEWFFK